MPDSEARPTRFLGQALLHCQGALNCTPGRSPETDCEWWGSERHREHARYIGQGGGAPSRRHHGSTRTRFYGKTDAIRPTKRNLLTCVTVGRLEPDLAIQSASQSPEM